MITYLTAAEIAKRQPWSNSTARAATGFDVWIFVAGGAGVLGCRIVSDKGHEITLLSRTPESRICRFARRIGRFCDAIDRDAVLQAVATIWPEVIMHQMTDLATCSSRANATFLINGTANLAAAADVVGFVLQTIARCYEPCDLPAGNRWRWTPSPAIPRRGTVDAAIAMEDLVQQLCSGRGAAQQRLYGPGT